MQDLKTLRIEIDSEGIATCTFNRPESRNALNLQMVDELHRVLAEFAGNAKIRGIIFTGSGEKAFLAGADISELRTRTQHDALGQINSRLFREVEMLPQPTFAAIRGYALGGGLEFAMACDLRVAGESAKLGQPEVSLGIIPGAGGCHRLARLVGLGRAKEIVYSARTLDAAEALQIGLVNRVTTDSEVYHATIELARAVLKNSSFALRLAKETFHATVGGESEYALAMESAAQALLFVDPEKNRRMDEFLAKKKARQG